MKKFFRHILITLLAGLLILSCHGEQGRPSPCWPDEDGSCLPWKIGPEKFAILAYHHVKRGGRLSTGDVLEEKLRRDLAHLLFFGYRVITFRDIADGGLDPDGRYIILTFDDGTKDHFMIVRPILNELGIPGVFYIVSGSVGWRSFMDWAQVQQLIDDGHEIGSHTHSHARLTELGEEELFSELVGSREELEGALEERDGGAYRVLSLAYPYCEFDDAVIRFLEKHRTYAFSVACCYHFIEWESLEEVTFRLGRFLMSQRFDMELFF